MFGAGQMFASCCVASVILCQSLLRTVDRQSISPAFWKLLVILQTRLLGFIFTAFMVCLSSTTVVFSADQVVVGRWWFPNSWFLHVLCFARALIDLFSLASKLLAFLSKSAPSSSSWFVWVIIECKIQNTEVMDITDTTHSLPLISE